MKKKLVFILITLFLLSFFLRFTLTSYSPVKYWDETIYSNLGRNLLIYGEYSFLHGFADFSPNWPLASFRPPLLPFIISLVSLISFNPFLLSLIIPIISSIGVIGLFFLTKEMFNQEVAVYSSVIFILFPLNIFWGSKILSDTLFLTTIIFSAYFFYLSFFKNRKPILNSILFGIFAGLSFLSRYSLIWFLLLFFLLLILKYKNIKFLLEKKLWISVISFALIVAPWFIFNYFQYGSLLGFLTQANQATLRWGAQGFFFYFLPFLKEFLILIPFLLLGIFIRNTKYKISKLFMVFWLIVIFIVLSFMGHKETRYLLPILPAVCILSSFGISQIKKFKKIIFIIIAILFLIITFYSFLPSYSSYNSQEQICFFNAMDLIKNSDASYVVTEHFSPVYFYTQKPNIRVNNYTIIKQIIETEHKKEIIYYYYETGDWFNLKNEDGSLDNVLYSCGKSHVFDIS